jgi:transcriptional regulator with XRE-family HTH domain
MKSYEVYTCRRKAAGLTRKQLADKCGIDVKIVEDYENGLWIDSKACNKIKDTLYWEFKNVDEVEHYRMRILELAMELKIERDGDYAMKNIAHMMVELGKLQMKIIDDMDR